jgi:hypothetical protein
MKGSDTLNIFPDCEPHFLFLQIEDFAQYLYCSW